MSIALSVAYKFCVNMEIEDIMSIGGFLCENYSFYSAT